MAVFDGEVAERLRSLRQHGMPVDAWKRFSYARSMVSFELTELGYKMNYSDLQACLGRVQLKRQGEFHEIRLAIANRYHGHLHGLIPSVSFQSHALHDYHARHLLPILLPVEEMALSRDELLVRLRERNIGASIHYHPLHMMPLYSCETQAPLANTENIWKRIITLPISASMNVEDADSAAVETAQLIQP